MTATTLMRRELLETPERLADQWQINQAAVAAAARDINARDNAPWWLAARGSSAHAGAFLATAAGLSAGRLVGDIASSLFTVYAQTPALNNAIVTAISQSGMGSDINTVVEAANTAGALTLGLTNNRESTLAAHAHHTIDLAMGPEKAVAATKTYLGTLAAAAHLVGAITDDNNLLAAVERLPKTLATRRDHAAPLDATALAAFDGPGFVLGRGIGRAVAREVALKFKEVCVTPVEAFSAAEFIHGPLTLVGPGTPILLLCQNDATRTGIIETAHRLADLGADVTLVGTALDDVEAAANMRIFNRPSTGHAYTDTIALAFDCYGALETRAVTRGYNPDQPPNVAKVTSTY